MAKEHLGLCLGTSPVPVGSNPAGEDYSSEQALSEVEYCLGLTPKGEQSVQGLIDHLSLAF